MNETSEPWSRRLGVQPIDAAVVAVVCVFVAVGTSHIGGSDEGARDPDVFAFVCGFTGALALVFWRRYTELAFVVVAGAMFAYLVRGYPGGPALLPGVLVMAAVGARVPRPRVWWFGVVYAAAVIGGQAIGDSELGLAGVVGTGWSIAAMFAGQLFAARAERLAADRERRQLMQQRAISDERLRIAQDLHDSVAHAMATINVQSGVAAHLIDRDPAQLRPALEAIRQASSEVLDELGTMIGTLRADGDGDGETAPRSPTVRLDRLGELVERARADGLDVTLAVDGDPASVPVARSTAAFRVVQEALSNTRRHAGADANVTVSVVVADDGVHIGVVDDGGRRRPAAVITSGLGLGLIGMRERVESTGGTLTAGPTDGGYAVEASWGRR